MTSESQENKDTKPLDRQRGAHILKVFSVGGNGSTVKDVGTKQITDPFEDVSGYGEQLRTPPYDMEQLVSLADANPIHSASIEQKVNDIVASGFALSPLTEEENEKDKQKILDWWDSLFDEFTSLEVLQAVWNDWETLGWGMLEVARDSNGIVRRLFHVPAHTVRAHISGEKLAQMRSGKLAWFKRWGSEIEDDLLVSTGNKAPAGTGSEKVANELLVFCKPSRRSTWYGIPLYISGLGHIALAIAARDFNIQFFENYREPRHLIIISGLQEDIEKAGKEIQQVWVEQLRANPHQNVLLPISGDAKITIEKMGTPINDMHFGRLMEQVDGEILVAHRMPPERLGIAKRGFLGGDGTSAVNSIYKEGVVVRGQNILESRLNRFMQIEYPKSAGISDDFDLGYRVDIEDLDITDEKMDVEIAVALAKSNLQTLNEIRARLGVAKHDAFAEMTLSEYLVSLGASSTQMMASIEEPPFSASQDRINHEILRRFEQVDGYIEDLLAGESST